MTCSRTKSCEPPLIESESRTRLPCGSIPVPHRGVRLTGSPDILAEHTAHLCTFSMAATSASAARLKNADTAGISGVLLRVSAASGLWQPSSWQPVSVTFGRLLCSCSFGLSSVAKGKFITRGSLCSLQRRDTEETRCQTTWNELLFFVHLSSTEYEGFYGFSSPMVITLFYQVQLQLRTVLCPETKWKRSCVLSKVKE